MVLPVVLSIVVRLVILVGGHFIAVRCKGCWFAALALAWNLLW